MSCCRGTGLVRVETFKKLSVSQAPLTPRWFQRSVQNSTRPGDPPDRGPGQGGAQHPRRGGHTPLAHVLPTAPQARGWSCTSAATGSRAAPRPRLPCTTGTWRRYCWMPSTSPAGAAPRARTATGGCSRRTAPGVGGRVPQPWLPHRLGQAGHPGPSLAWPASQGSAAGSENRGQVLPGLYDTAGPPPPVSHAPPGLAPAGEHGRPSPWAPLL